MSQRYSRRKKFVNRLEMYADQIRDRNVNLINHYSSPDMTYPDAKERAKIKNLSHIWKQGDRYYKLAHKHYGETELWWVIAWYNKKPTEAHLKTGDAIFIPFPLEAALSFMRSR